jgi:hypothetical protein
MGSGGEAIHNSLVQRARPLQVSDHFFACRFGHTRHAIAVGGEGRRTRAVGGRGGTGTRMSATSGSTAAATCRTAAVQAGTHTPAGKHNTHCGCPGFETRPRRKAACCWGWQRRRP